MEERYRRVTSRTRRDIALIGTLTTAESSSRDVQEAAGLAEGGPTLVAESAAKERLI